MCIPDPSRKPHPEVTYTQNALYAVWHVSHGRILRTAPFVIVMAGRAHSDRNSGVLAPINRLGSWVACSVTNLSLHATWRFQVSSEFLRAEFRGSADGRSPASPRGDATLSGHYVNTMLSPVLPAGSRPPWSVIVDAQLSRSRQLSRQLSRQPAVGSVHTSRRATARAL
jgi:hypothetical protein